VRTKGSCGPLAAAPQTRIDPMDNTWSKSSHSASNGACVEARTVNNMVQVRDSKDPNGPVLTVDRDTWTDLVNWAKTL
jgi:Domain of unknown function (DUF397)